MQNYIYIFFNNNIIWKNIRRRIILFKQTFFNFLLFLFLFILKMFIEIYVHQSLCFIKTISFYVYFNHKHLIAFLIIL